jgi:hypothetical protein
MKTWRWLGVAALPLLLGLSDCPPKPPPGDNFAEGWITYTAPNGAKYIVHIIFSTIPTAAYGGSLGAFQVSVPVSGTPVTVQLGTSSVTPATLQQVDTIWGVLDEAQFIACRESLLNPSSSDTTAYYNAMSTILVAYATDLATAKTDQEVQAANAKANAAAQQAGTKPPTPQSGAGAPGPAAPTPTAGAPGPATPTPTAGAPRPPTPTPTAGAPPPPLPPAPPPPAPPPPPSPSLTSRLTNALQTYGLSSSVLNQSPRSLSDIPATR